MDKTGIEQWEDIADQTKKVQIELYRLLLQYNQSNVPKEVGHFQYTRMEDALYKFQNLMEDRFNQEYSREDIEMYYNKVGEGDE